MYLKRLEIQGFKSFAKKTTLEFETGITAIVGPNGSGKSNAADCLRWVLGEQSPKLMRGKKSDDVIFAGSDKRGRAGMAEVIATFDNADGKIPVETAEVSIGRRVSRTGESEYLINGQKARLLDIIELVLKSNIGTSRYTVIGQGTIDQMILAGPSEIKNLIDEASGVKTYYIKRDRTLKRLETTAQNLMRAEDLLAELRPRVKSLRRQAKRMEARAQIEVELKQLLFKHLGGQWWQFKSQSDQLVEQIDSLLTERQKLEATMQVHLQEIEKHEQDNQDVLAEYQDLQTKIKVVVDAKNALVEQISLVKGKMTGMQGSGGDAASLEIESHKLGTQISQLKSQLQAAQEQQIASKKIIDEAQAQMVQLQSETEELYNLLQNPQTADWSLVEKALKQFDDIIVRFEQVLDDATDLNTISNAAVELKSAWNQLKTQATKDLVNPGAESQKLQDQIKALNTKKDELQNQLNNWQMDLSKAVMSQEFVTGQLNNLENQKLQVDLELKKAQSGGSENFVKDLVLEEQKIQDKIDQKSQEQQSLEAELQKLYSNENSRKAAIAQEDKEFRDKQAQLSQIRDGESQLQVQKAKADTHLETVTNEIRQQLGDQDLNKISAQKLDASTEQEQEKISQLKRQLELTGGVDDLTIAEYQETEARYTGLEEQVVDLQKSMSDLREVMDELDSHIKTKFTKAFHKINVEFEQYFKLLFNGGRAKLVLVKDKTEVEDIEEQVEDLDDDQDSANLRPEEKIIAKYEKGSINIAGVDIKATPPGKKLSNIQSLSGGERSLTSIALLSSLLTCFPSPFVVLDEVDAALDDANTIRFGQILGKLSHQTQFITITHNRETMAQANIIYGVTMGDDGVSQLLSIKMDQAKAYAK
ncbi:MAG: AAA family ATPase [Candidatus Doudnabacteria bacterium]